MPKQKKYYAVKKGVQPGIYTEWDAAKKNVDGFKNASFKSFITLKEAQEYMEPNKVEPINSDGSIKIYVDGSFDKRYGSGVYITDQNNQMIKKISFGGSNEKFMSSRNVAGECLAALRGMKWALENNYKKINLIFDYIGIENWLKKTWEANTPISKFYVQEFENKYKNKISIDFSWVKGHTGNFGNEAADKLAKLAATREWKE